MSVLHYGVRYVCDLCKREADKVPPALDTEFTILNQAVPPHWTYLGSLNLSMINPYGVMISHLCPACSGLSIGEIAQELHRKAEEDKAHGPL